MKTLNNIYQQHLSACISRQCAATKEHIDANRSQFANNRHSSGFSDSMRQLTFALCMERASGAEVYDIDGNKYADITMGFGVHLFGHSPAFVTEALQQQLADGYSVGPVHTLAARAASLICKMTSNDRCAFFNSGTEAVMVALRLARAATGKSKVVVFEGGYHGTHDPLLVMKADPITREAVANVPGISQSLVQDTILLEFGTEESMRIIKERAADIGAVISEPVRSRHPEDVNPAFLHALQKVCIENNIAFVLDEIITGFRVGNGGAKELFGLDPDIITYGKVLGGGMPIGVVAGKKKYLDYIDGGDWSFTDERRPSSPTTFVAGTFCHHPLAMAATVAVLQHLDNGKGQLQKELNDNTAAFCDDINNFCSENNIPVSIARFSSMFRFLIKPKHRILYHALLKEQVYVWEGRTCFLSAAHDGQARKRIAERIKKCLLEMKAAGYFPSPAPAPAASGWYIKGGLAFDTLLDERWLQFSFSYLCECLSASNKYRYSPADIRLSITNENGKTSIILECLKTIGDGWSLTLFFRFLSDCYRSLEDHQPLPSNPFKDKAAFYEWAGGTKENRPHPAYNASSIEKFINTNVKRNHQFEWLLAAFAISLGEGEHEIGVPVSGQLISRHINVFHTCTCQVQVKVSVTPYTAPGDLINDISQQVTEAKKDFRRWYFNEPSTPLSIVFNVDNIKEGNGFAGRPVKALNIVDHHTSHDIVCNIITAQNGFHLSIKYKEGVREKSIAHLADRYASLIQEGSYVPS